MSTINDFNRIDDCDKIDPLCVDSYTEFDFDPNNETGICLHTSWGGNCLDLTSIVKAAESCTSLYLSPDENPNCLVYEKEERCGDNDCIHGDDLSRIISLHLLKDVDQTQEIANGDTYIFNSETNLFEPYPLAETIGAIQTTLQNIQQTLVNHENRLQAIEALLVKPAGAGDDAKLCWGTINVYGDYNAVVDGQGTATSLDKSHGLYTHDLSVSVPNDQLLG